MAMLSIVVLATLAPRPAALAQAHEINVTQEERVFRTSTFLVAMSGFGEVKLVDLQEFCAFWSGQKPLPQHTSLDEMSMGDAGW